MNLTFLQQIHFVRTSFSFNPVAHSSTPPELPPFAGSALRGAFGHSFRRRLCYFAPQRGPGNPCDRSGECAEPANCEYFRLFERSHQNNASGPNVVKPYILEPPIPPELEAIASAASPVVAPFRQTSGNAIENSTPLAVPNGFSVGFTLLGQSASLLDPVVDLLKLSPLQIGPHRFVLDRVQEPVVARLQGEARQKSSSLRIGFITPCRHRAPSAQGGAYRFHAEEFAAQFWQAALIRAMRVRDQFCSDGERLPWIDFPPGILPQVTGTQLYRYHYERLSNRQQKKMDFDGMIGSIWYEGEGLRQLAPLVEAAEVLHIGQKATFGLGLVRGEWLAKELRA